MQYSKRKLILQWRKIRFITRCAKLVDTYAHKLYTFISDSQQRNVNSKFHKLVTYKVSVDILNQMFKEKDFAIHLVVVKFLIKTDLPITFQLVSRILLVLEISARKSLSWGTLFWITWQNKMPLFNGLKAGIMVTFI